MPNTTLILLYYKPNKKSQPFTISINEILYISVKRTKSIWWPAISMSNGGKNMHLNAEYNVFTWYHRYSNSRCISTNLFINIFNIFGFQSYESFYFVIKIVNLKTLSDILLDQVICNLAKQFSLQSVGY